MDPAAFFDAVKNGGPSAIFVLVMLLTLILTGQLRTKGTVESEMAALEKAHRAELAARDHQIAELIRIQERLTERMDRNQELFGESMSLIRQEVMPMLRAAVGPARAS
jgi:hypothetical protein